MLSPCAPPLLVAFVTLDLDPSWILGLAGLSALVLLVVLMVRRQRDDPSLRAGPGWTLWRTADEVFWGRLEPRGQGLALHFEKAYAPPGEPRRSALVLDGREASRCVALARPNRDVHFDAERGGAGGPNAFWPDTLEQLELGLERALGSNRPTPLQDRAFLERSRDGHVVVELGNGARVAGRLTHVGGAWLRLVDARDDSGPSTVRVTERDEDAGFEVRATDDAVVLAGPDHLAHGAVHVVDVRDGTRTWALGVTLLPHTRAHLPWTAEGPRDLEARAEIGGGLELLVPRASARVVFAGAPSAN